MLNKSVKVLALGENYLFASILYFGLGLLVIGLAPSMPSVHAAVGIDCPEGQVAVMVGEGHYECQCPSVEPDE
jgi:hypothetical protein